MNLSRYVIVLALLTAAAVLYPIQRAQAALARATPMRATTLLRVPTRRRVNNLRTVKRSQPAADRQDPGGTQDSRRLASASPAADSASHSGAQRVGSVHPATAHDGPGDVGDCLLDRVTHAFRPEQLSAPGPTPRTAAVTQAVADVPKPPPKQA